MPQQARDAEFAPHAAIDLRDQNSMFLALEELGIACMQDAWIRSNDPGHKDAAAVHEQAEEFLVDILMLLSTGGDESRIVQNGWAGAELAKHLRASLRQELAAETAAQGLEGGTDAMSDEAVIRLALSCYLKDLELLTARDAHEKMLGRKIEPKEYIDFMIGWSGVFSGAKPSLELPMAFMIFKGAQKH